MMTDSSPERRREERLIELRLGDGGATALTNDATLTIVFSWDVLPGHEAEFEGWAHELTVAASAVPGHLSATWLRPAPGRQEYLTIVRFRDDASFHAWYTSPTRAALLARVGAFTAERKAKATGLETWFTLPGKAASAPPPRWKMFLVTSLAVYPISLLFALTLTPWMHAAPAALRTLVTTVLLVSALTWLVMPRLTQALCGWLYARRQ